MSQTLADNTSLRSLRPLGPWLGLAATTLLSVGLAADVAGLSVVAILVSSVVSLGPIAVAAAGLGGLLQRLLPSVPAAGGDGSAAAGFDPRRAVVTRLILGLAWLFWLNWLTAWLVGVGPLVAWGLCGAGAAGLVAEWWMQRAKLRSPIAVSTPSWTLVLLGLPLGLLITAASCPPGTLWAVEALGYDVTSYHLQLPREWLQAGAMVGLEHNVYGYLPGLMEAAYLWVAVLRGQGMVAAVYDTQLLHAILAGLAAWQIGAAVGGPKGPSPSLGWVLAAVGLCVPWVLITGSLAYNEMAVLASGAAALAISLAPTPPTAKSAAAVGLLLGTATMAKLTAGPLVAVPVGLILLSRQPDAPGESAGDEADASTRTATGIAAWRRRLTPAAICVVVGLIALTPYFARNAVWTGNPVFPFAGGWLGLGHFTAEQMQRWQAAHSSDANLLTRLYELARQWLCNTGYGAVAGWQVERQATEVARFSREWGLPVLWLPALAAGFAAAVDRLTRRRACLLLGMLGIQLAFWLAFTHLQSRFLIPTLLPMLWLLGLGLVRVEQLRPRAGAVFGAGLALLLFILSLNTLQRQTPTFQPENGPRTHLPVAVLVDSLVPDPASPEGGLVGYHRLNRLPEQARTHLEADAGRVLYIRGSFTYRTAFDGSLLGELIEQHESPAAVVQALHDRGYTHLWVNLAEINRLRATYGYHPAVTETWIRQAITREYLRPIRGSNTPGAALFRLAVPATGPAAGNPEP